MRATPSQLNKNVASVGRFHEGDNCIGEKIIDTDKDLARNFGEVIGKLNPLLKHEVCFTQTTSIEREINNDVKQIILEKHNKIPAELRIEAESDRGFEVFQGKCEEIPHWAQGQLELIPILITERMDIDLFEHLKDEQFFLPLQEDPAIYENPFFIQDTTIIVKPRFIQTYVFLSIIIGWILIVLQVIAPLYKEYRSLGTTELKE